MINFASIKFNLLSRSDIIKDHVETLFVVTANSEIIVKYNEEIFFQNLLTKASFTFDGQIPFVLAKILNPKAKIEKISGSDLVYDICELANRSKRKIFLLGGLEESNFLSQQKIKKLYPNLEISGFSPTFSPYPFSEELNELINQKIKLFSPDYLFVGFGAGKQENWISDNLDLLKHLNVQVAVGSGGTFEFVSGKIKRAPKLIQKIGLEGVFRLLVEPNFFRFRRIIKSFKIFYYAFKN
ncbi:MAG: WecB/TagA/CpsF family glycosyltransferase [Bacteriovorax sp.]|nr:WecB/TagA/CpsF family glycosyltransferase [Bacteriovorax sp.]